MRYQLVTLQNNASVSIRVKSGLLMWCKKNAVSKANRPIAYMHLFICIPDITVLLMINFSSILGSRYENKCETHKSFCWSGLTERIDRLIYCTGKMYLYCQSTYPELYIILKIRIVTHRMTHLDILHTKQSTTCLWLFVNYDCVSQVKNTSFLWQCL